MTKSTLPGPGLTPEQWQRLTDLATSLTPEQSNWIGGYFTGFADAGRRGAPLAGVPVEELAQTAAGQRTLTILYGTETGNGTEIAKNLAAKAVEMGLAAKALDMADYRTATLKQEQDLIIITSTHGEGEPPQPALGFFDFLDGRKAPKLDGARFAVLSLGDSTYEFFCEAGKRLDKKLEELGAQRIAPRIDCDVDQIGQGRDWAMDVLAKLAETGGVSPAKPVVASVAVATATSYAEDNPFQAEIFENLVLTGRGSSKETRHLEIGLSDSSLTYLPGDALGIVARNDQSLVEDVLEAIGCQGNQQVVLDKKEVSLAEALETGFEIATATPRFLSHWAGIAEAKNLAELAGPEKAAERSAYLRDHHVLDIMRLHPVPGIKPDTFLAGLRRLQPRLYSIASSQNAQDGDVHLTVSTVCYQLHGTERRGIVSGGLERSAKPGDTLPVYVKANPHFRLPADDVPIIMIGAGTGIAPYRAFLQERELNGAHGQAWLFFGERNFRSDFLYQVEWQDYLKTGLLSRMDVAFSRDGQNKAYVQHKLREQGRDVYAWLEDGAHFYVCGDATGMAPDVHQTLVDVVADAGGLSAEAADEYVRGLQRDGRYQRDVY